MKISTVKIKNFRGYGENVKSTDGFYSFNKLNECDFLILNGYNGFGKTSFFEAIEWCLTNTVQRLKSFEDNDSRTNLRSNRYLIFIPLDKTKRKAEVVIKFSDGNELKRMTDSESLQANDYAATTKLYFNTQKIKSIDEDDFYGHSLKKIFKVNFLGQETILDLLKKDKPAERSASFLSLIDLSELNKIEAAARYRFGFDPKSKKNTEQLKKLSEDKEKVDALFQQKDWNSFNEYVEKVKAKLKVALQEKTKLKLEDSKRWINEFVTEKEITKENCYEFIQSINVNSFRVEEKYTKRLRQREVKSDYEGCKKAILLFDKNKKIDFIKDFKIKYRQFFLSGYKRYTELTENENLQLQEIQDKIKFDENIWEKFLNSHFNVDSVFKDFNVSEEEFGSSKKKFAALCSYLEKLPNNVKQKIFNEDLLLDKLRVLKTEIDKISISQLNTLLQQFKENKESFNKSHKEKEKRLKELSGLNSDYVKLLNDVKSYLEGVSDLKECPVCLSENFSEGIIKTSVQLSDGTSIKEQLKAIISNKVSSGNESVNKLQKDFDTELIEFNKKEKEVRGKFKDEYYQILVKINVEIREFLGRLSVKLELLENLNQGNIVKIKDRESSLNERIKQYRKYYKDIFEEDYSELEDSKVIDESLIKQNNEFIDQIKLQINRDQELVNTLKEFIALRDKLKPIVVKEKNETLDAKIQDAKLAISIFKMFEDFVLTETDQKMIQATLDFDKKKKTFERQIEKIKTDKVIVSTISQNVSKEKDQILSKLFDNELIKYIYKEINPHFRFDKIKLENEKRGQQNLSNVKQEDENIYLNQIFSAAQLNIISLSIFLGMGLPEKGSKFEQLFLDDPIQSMDDLNILALIDVFRGLVDIKNTKRIILSTHDDNFAKLLKVKMRNKNIKVIDFESYGNEGPLIKIS
ncbi:hypothetical protein EMN47_17025 [Prolixibacteraceae bacterium JC049]|nr:hypothetical protein [Prolixibacteraceae bacterium JC049]